MPRVKYSVEHIIHKLREGDVLLAQGQTVKDICRQWSITDPTDSRWRQEYGGLKLDQAKRLKDLERVNARLKRAVAELTLDKLLVKEAAEGNFSAPPDDVVRSSRSVNDWTWPSDMPVRCWGNRDQPSGIRLTPVVLRKH